MSYSETVLTHIADMSDCPTHSYMSCGAIVAKMDDCAAIVAAKHCQVARVTTAAAYNVNFMEMVPRG